MRLHDIQYLIKEGLRNTWHHRFMALASVGVLISCLLLTGFSYLFLENVNHMFQTAYEQNVVAVFLDKDLADDAVERMGDTLRQMDELAEVNFISKEESLERYGADLPPETFASLQGEENPLQDTYIVSLKDLETFEPTLAKIEALEGVEDVTYDGDIAATLTRVRRIVLGIGGAVVLLLLAVSLFIIINTIKLTVYNRRREISIMKSVGATDGFIRLPFIVEGVVLGLVAGVVGYGILALLYSQLVKNLDLGMLLNPVAFGQVWGVLLTGFLVGGVLVGVIGSAISTTRYLKQEGGKLQW